MEAELHLEAVGDGAELFLELLRRVAPLPREGGAQVQGAAKAVVELLMLVNVEAAVEQEGRHCVDDARAFSAGQREDELSVLFRRGGNGWGCGQDCLCQGYVSSLRYIPC